MPPVVSQSVTSARAVISIISRASVVALIPMKSAGGAPDGRGTVADRRPGDKGQANLRGR